MMVVDAVQFHLSWTSAASLILLVLAYDEYKRRRMSAVRSYGRSRSWFFCLPVQLVTDGPKKAWTKLANTERRSLT